MKTAIIVHGTCDEEEYFGDNYPSPSNSHWIPWLQKQFLMENWLKHLKCHEPIIPFTKIGSPRSSVFQSAQKW